MRQINGKNEMCMWERPREIVSGQGGRSPHIKYHFQLKTKESVGLVVWDLKGKGDSLNW